MEEPAIFVQKRVGKNGRIFNFYKFRSMYIDAEKRKKELMAQNQMQGGTDRSGAGRVLCSRRPCR